MTTPPPEAGTDAARVPARGVGNYVMRRLITEAPWYVWMLFGALVATMILTLIMILGFRFSP